MKTILKLMAVSACMLPAFLLTSCYGDSHRFSSTFVLYETDIDGEPWYTISSNKHSDMQAPFPQYVDGVCQDGDLVYIWVNGTREPDYYCLDLTQDTCTRLQTLPPHVTFVSAKQFLQEH